MENYLIIGASGYIGSALYHYLIKNDLLVTGTSTKGSEKYLQLNLENPKNLNEIKLNKYSCVFFVAAISSPDICAKEHEYAQEINVKKSSEIISTFLQNGIKVIFLSSDTVYGEQINSFNENMQANPLGDYALMKYQVENKFKDYDLFKAIRLSYVFSRQDKFTRYLLKTTEKKEIAEIFHPLKRSVIYINDVVEGLISLSREFYNIKEKVINFGGPKNISRLEFAKIIKENYLENLLYKKVNPNDSFFENRAKVINMDSPLLTKLLNKKANNLNEAVKKEFI